MSTALSTENEETRSVGAEHLALETIKELASRMVTVKEDKESLVRAVLENDEKTKEVLVWCHSTLKEKKEEGIKNLFRQRF